MINSLPQLKIRKKKKRVSTSIAMLRLDQGRLPKVTEDCTSEKMVPRVAQYQAWPKHKQSLRGKNYENLYPSTASEKDQGIAGCRKNGMADYLNQQPKPENIDKELTNNRIKIMNMKTDYIRFKNLLNKIHCKSISKIKRSASHSNTRKPGQQMQLQQSVSLRQLQQK